MEHKPDLVDWRTNRHAASLFFCWFGGHPARAKEFVEWFIAHPFKSIVAFASLHPNWPRLDEMATKFRPAMVAFIEWLRNHPGASRDLISQPLRLQWAGSNIGRVNWSWCTAAPAA